MKSTRRLALLLSLVAISFAVAWDFTPRSAGRSGNPKNLTVGEKGVGTPASIKTVLANSNMPIPQPTVEPEPEEYEDPDLPPGMTGKVDKEAYLRARGDYFDMLRGRGWDGADQARESAIRQMERQERSMKRTRSLSPLVDTVNWVPLGPAPIPLGQVTAPRVPVSGRTISIAVHPTNPDIVYVGTAQGGLYKSTNGGTNWTSLFEFQLESLAIGAITIDPVDTSIVYVGTGENGQSADSTIGRGMYIIRNANSATPTLNGPFRLNGAGADVFSGRAIGRIIVNPLDTNTLFLCTSSATGGNPNTTALPTPPRGLYRSTNAQSATPTFEQVQITGLPTPNDRTAIDLAMDPANPNLLLVTIIGVGTPGDGGIYRTADALAPTPTFTRTHALASGATTGRAELTVTRSAAPATTFYAATGEQSTVALGGPACGTTQLGVVRRSTDGGLTWSAPSAMNNATGYCGGQCFYDIAIAVTPDNQTIHLGGAAGNSGAACGAAVMKRSLNGGTTWAGNTGQLHADSHALAIAPSNSQIVYAGNDGGIWKSINNGTTWVTLNNSEFSAVQFQGVSVHPFARNFLLGGTQDNGTNCLFSAGTWSHCADGDGGYTLIDDNAADTTNVTMYHTFFNQTNSQIRYERATSTAANANGILSWSSRGCSGSGSVGNGIDCTNAVLFYAPLAQGPGTPNIIYFGSDRLYRSVNRGDNHTIASQSPLVPVNATQGVVITTIGISPQDDNVRIVGMRDGKVFATTTGSSTLTNVTGANFPAPNPADPNRNSIGEAIIDPHNKFTAWVSFTSFTPLAGQQIFKTTNLNDPTPTWTPASNGIPPMPISALAIDPQDSNIVYAATEIGVYQTTDGGANWAPYGIGLPRVAVFDVKISDVQRYLRIATHGKGIWEIGIPGRQAGVIRNGVTTIVNEGCVPGNGAIDPGEDVTVSLSVTNLAAAPAATEDLVVTLLPTGGVTFPSGPVHYGSIAPGASASQNFNFSNNGNCGDTITLTFHLQDGPIDLGNMTFTYTLGVQANSPTTFTENFDGVVAPALPAGWTTARSGTGATPVLWVTSTTTPDTPPNAAFGAGSTTPGESTLTSPTIPIPAAPVGGTNPGVRLSFRNNYNTEPGFDGGVLEISINGGPFADVTTAGGSFVEGGYSGSIGAPPAESTLSGRAAWTGSSGGYITSTVVLPPASYGQNAQLRWRTAYDNGTNPAGGGQRVDSISIYPSTRFCCGGPCVLTCPSDITQSNDPGLCGATVTYPAATKSGNCSVNPVVGNPPSGSFFPVGTTNVVVTDTKLDGSTATCDFDVTVNDTEVPVLSNPTTTPNTLWPPNHQMENVTVNYTVTDNCPVTCTLTVASNEPINGLGDGDTAPDWVVVDDHHVQLRAERSGKGNGRIYTITTTCTDGTHTVSKNSTVLVPKSMKGGSWTVVNIESRVLGAKDAAPALTNSIFLPNPVITGLVNFDLSKASNAKVPKVENLFNLVLGEVQFQALNYDFRELAGARTTFKGYGKVNNETGYKYLLTVIDGQAPKGGGVDKFRIKIWNEKTGDVVFDNQKGDADEAEPTTPVGDGSSIRYPR